MASSSPLLLHTTTDVPPWRHPHLAALDALLHDAGSVAVPFPIGLPLEEDGLHFTAAAQTAFARTLAERVARVVGGRTLLVVTDSTVGHHEWGSAALEGELARHGVPARVDAVCGSGYVAGAGEGRHFRARVPHRGGYDAILLMGGWNDVGWGRTTLLSAARGVLRLVQS